MMLRSARPPLLRRAGKRAPEDEGVKGKVRGSSRTSWRAEAERPAQPLPCPEQAPFQARLGHDFGSIPVQHGLGARGAPAPAPAGPGKVAKDGVIQRDLATPEPAIAPGAQPDLTDEQIQGAIAFNRQRFGFNPASTRLIQDLVGTEPTGVWSAGDIRAIAAVQERYGVKKDGMVGDNTFRFLDREVRAERLNRGDANCLVSFHVLSAPPVVGPVAGGRRSITVRFTMHARFPTHCGCPDYQYRQFIRGHWRRERGGVVTDLGPTFDTLPGGAGLPAAFIEDGNTSSTALNYGHREQPAEGINHYLNDSGAEDQANGCRYEGEDTPGGPDSVVAGDVFDIRLDFRGEIQRRGRTVTSLQWTPIRGRFPVP